MAARYLLPCECGATTPIEVNQAGSSVVCSCGKTLEVPSLRAVRQLTPCGDSMDKRESTWNPAAGMIFVSGVAIALVGASVAFFMHMNSLQAVNFVPPPESEVAAWVAEVDTASPEELFEMWNYSRHMGLGERSMSPFVHARIVSQRFATNRNVALVVMASGLAFAGTSLFLRRNSVANAGQ